MKSTNVASGRTLELLGICNRRGVSLPTKTETYGDGFRLVWEFDGTELTAKVDAEGVITFMYFDYGGSSGWKACTADHLVDVLHIYTAKPGDIPSFHGATISV